MQYFSLNNNAKAVGFEKAVRLGLAPDRGLYFPQQIDPLRDSFWDNFLQMSHHEIALHVIEQFVGDEIPKDELQKIILSDVPNKIYPELEKSLLDLLHNSGYPNIKFEKKVDFEELYKQRFN